MSLAALSLTALLVAVTLGSTTRLNVGIVSIVLAWGVGVYVGGMPVNDVLAGFPSALFLTLTGVTLLFAQAQNNGTLERVAQSALGLCRGNVGLMPVVFFVVALVLATVGPGNIASAALVAPVALSVGSRVGISPFLMAIMVGHGATAGALSPFAPTGIVANQKMAEIGLAGREWESYGYNLLANAVVAFAGYFALGGRRLFSRRHHGELGGVPTTLGLAHWLTLVAIGGVLVSVIGFGAHVGMAAFAGALLLVLCRAASESEAIKQVPWGVILMVSGVSVLIALLTKTQGLDLFTDGMARLASPATAPAVMAFASGVLSAYGSTTGVVLPVFLPTIPGLVARLGGGDPMSIATSINVGANLVDVSPLSTIGALCLAGAASAADGRRLFNQLLAWGLSMTIVGAAIAALFL